MPGRAGIDRGLPEVDKLRAEAGQRADRGRGGEFKRGVGRSPTRHLADEDRPRVDDQAVCPPIRELDGIV